MGSILYERLCADDRRPSPYCWRARLACAHKGIEPEYRAIKFTESDKVSFSGQGKVPVLVDDDYAVSDSWGIACYLEDTYSKAPSLFGGDGGRHMTRTFNHWVDTCLQKSFAPILAPSLHEVAHPDDRAHYKQTRETKWGRSFDDMRRDRSRYRAELDKTLEPLRARLAEAPFLCGEEPAYADYLAFSEFQWARCVDAEDLLADSETPLRDWRSRMLDLHDGLARRVTAFAGAAQ